MCHNNVMFNLSTLITGLPLIRSSCTLRIELDYAFLPLLDVSQQCHVQLVHINHWPITDKKQLYSKDWIGLDYAFLPLLDVSQQCHVQIVHINHWPTTDKNQLYSKDWIGLRLSTFIRCVTTMSCSTCPH